MPFLAYIDPGSVGSFLEIGIGIVAGLVVLLVLYWDPVLDFVRRLGGRDG